MKITILAIWVAISALVMQENKTPEGTFCTPNGVVTSNMVVIDPAHPCHCEHMTYEDPKDHTCEGQVVENAKCSNYCSKEKCRCPVKCEKFPDQPGSN